MSDTPQPVEKPKLRWYQYRLWHLFALMTLVAIACAGWAWCLLPRAEYRRAAAPIEELGGNVGGHPRLGVEGIDEINLQFIGVTNADLKKLKEHLETLPNLKGLFLDFGRINDAGLEHLKGLSNLEELSLGGTQVTDAGLMRLKGLLPNLKRLSLLGCGQVSDAGLEHLKGLTKLEGLTLHGT